MIWLGTIHNAILDKDGIQIAEVLAKDFYWLVRSEKKNYTEYKSNNFNKIVAFLNTHFKGWKLS